MAVCDAYVFPGFLTPVLTKLFFPKPPTTFLTCFCRGERRKYAGKKSRLNRGSNSQPPGHESDTLTTEPPGRGLAIFGENFLRMLFYIILYLCNPHYTLLYYQLNRYLVSLYQVIWTFTDPENDGFWKTYLDMEKMLVTSSFSCYYNVFYSTFLLYISFLSSANALNLDISKFLSFGMEV